MDMDIHSARTSREVELLPSNQLAALVENEAFVQVDMRVTKSDAPSR